MNFIDEDAPQVETADLDYEWMMSTYLKFMRQLSDCKHVSELLRFNESGFIYSQHRKG